MDIEIKDETKSLPTLKGMGYIADSLYAYNMDNKLFTMAQDYSSDIGKVANNFDEFLAQWSGFYAMDESKGISKEDFTNNVERNLAQKVWVLEQFAGELVDSWRVEVHLKENTNGRYHNTTYRNTDYINTHYENLLNHYESTFAIQTVYQDVFTDVHYNQFLNMMIVDDTTAMNQKVKDYLNDTSIELDKRLYLASVMKKQGVWFNFDKEDIISNITDTYTQDLVSNIYNGKVNLQVFTDQTAFSENDRIDTIYEDYQYGYKKAA